jgi:hypothetical protein
MRRLGQSSAEATSAASNVVPIFLISAPRSGSSWLRNLLGLHPDIATGPETYAVEALAQLLATIERRAGRGQGLLARGYLDRPALYRACARFFRDAVASQVAGRAYFLEKTPLNTDFVDVIHAVFPAARLLHLIRDGRDVTYSMVLGQARGRHFPDTLRGCAERWARIERVMRFGRSHAELYCEIRYEAALADLRAELTRVFAFLRLPLPEPVLAAMQAAARTAVHPSPETATHGYREKWRGGFSAADVAAFKEAAGALLVELGYEHDGNW